MLYISENMEFQLKNTAVCLGKFDGIHRGHRLLINKILEKKKEGYTAVVFTFSLHPLSLFSDKELELIDTIDEKKDKLRKLGVDILVSYPFTKETAATEPEDFIENILVNQLDAKVIVIGSDYRFGRKRRGDVAMLEQYSKIYGYELIVYDKLEIDDEIVGSTLIRSVIQSGNMEKVTKLLGVPYEIQAKVVTGNQIGRTIGFPTLNQAIPSNKLLPPNGVYVSKTIIDGIEYESVTNLGCKPTVSSTQTKNVETYIFNFEADLYDKVVTVKLLKWLRPEMKFSGLEELKTQIGIDKKNTISYFQNL